MALIIPKNNADAQTLDATLRIYYEANDWVQNSVLIEKLSSALDNLGIEDEKKEPQSYTKKTQVLAYFGFITWQDVTNSQSARKITELGKSFYEARLEKDTDKTISVIIKSLNTCTFGRNVIGCDSDSDIEAPNVFIKASLLLKGLSNNEFAFILGRMELHGEEFHDSVLKIKVNRIKGTKTYPEENAKKWNDPKPITALKNWGFFNSDDNTISDKVFLKYADQLLLLRTKNTEPVRFKSVNEQEIQDNDEVNSYLSYLTAIRTKPFLLLAGISGTGKSRIVRELAFKSCPKYLQDKNGTTPGNYCMIEVKPNWHDSSELLGYYSSFNGGGYRFTKFDRFVVKAWLNPDVPFFVCLDEMNLAPVEQYFAEFLSVLETRSRDKEGHVVTGALVDKQYFKDDTKMTTELGLDKGDDWTIKVRSDLVNKGLTLPPNLIAIGTVNMDDTTYQFSRKVIDRAMTIEMNGGELSQMFGNSNSLKYRSDEDVVKLGLFKAPYINADEVIERYQSQAQIIKEKLPEKLEAVNTALKDTPFQVSYRVLNELVIYLGALMDESTAKGEAIDDDALPALIDQAMDQITLMKILPRIEGDEDMFRRSGGTNVLKTLQSLFSEDSDSYRKLKEMADRLDRTGFTRFWP
jgi:hypothetical protein